MTEAEQTNDTIGRAIERLILGMVVSFLLSFLAASFIVIVYWAFNPHLAPAGAGFVQADPAIRTLWDWMDLLIVPLAVAAGAAIISYFQKRTELDIAKKARESEQTVASDKQQQATLEAYYDRMTDLLLEHSLRESDKDSEVRSIARARTVAVIRSLDGGRINQLLAFLRSSGLIDRDQSVIDLTGIDLSQTDLSGVDLHETNLSEAVLIGTNLSQTILAEANLSRAYLKGANLSQAVLVEANLSQANLIEVNLSRAYLVKTNLSQAELPKANLSQAYLRSADLRAAGLNRANLSRAYLREVNLSLADLREADLNGVEGWNIEQLEQVGDFEGATMPDGVVLGGVDFFGRPIGGPTFAEWKAQYLAENPPGR